MSQKQNLSIIISSVKFKITRLFATIVVYLFFWEGEGTFSWFRRKRRETFRFPRYRFYHNNAQISIISRLLHTEKILRDNMCICTSVFAIRIYVYINVHFFALLSQKKYDGYLLVECTTSLSSFFFIYDCLHFLCVMSVKVR